MTFTLSQLVCILLQRFKEVILLSFIALAPVHAGDEVGNGSGYFENLIVMAYQNLPATIDKTLDSEEELQAGTRSLLVNIKNEALSFKANQILFFKKDKAIFDGSIIGDIFTIDGLPKIAVTGSEIGSPIYFNLDFLYGLGDAQPQLRDFTYSQALSLIVHELGHHHGIKDHTMLDDLGYRVASMIESSIVEVSLNFTELSPKIILGYKNDNLLEVGSLHILRKESLVDLLGVIENKFTQKVRVQLSNIHWISNSSVRGFIRISHKENLKSFRGFSSKEDERTLFEGRVEFDLTEERLDFLD